MEDSEGVATTHISVTTYNVLAPCYDDLIADYSDVSKWKPKHEGVLQHILTIKPDVLCLQEFFFYPAFQSLYIDTLTSAGYGPGEFLQRTGRKEDGVAIFFKPDLISLLDTRPIQFKDAGDRVALLLLLQVKATGQKFVLVNTHLTFPHHQFDMNMRGEQTDKIIANVAAYVEKFDEIPVILAGDFNGSNDNVTTKLRDHDFVSTFYMKHNREAIVTHLNHRGHSVGVDYIWFKEYKKDTKKEGTEVTTWTVEDCHVFPRELPDHRWPRDFPTHSDHRPLTTFFTITHTKYSMEYSEENRCGSTSSQNLCRVGYLVGTFWVNLIANAIVNGAIATGVYCCSGTVPLVGDTVDTALQGVLDYSIVSVYFIAFFSYLINAVWAARDVRAVFCGLRGYPRPEWMIDHPVKKFIADLFYVNDVLHVRKDCCRDPDGEYHWGRTVSKWLLIFGKANLFSFVVLVLFCIPAVPILVSIDKTDAVTWDVTAMIVYQIILSGLLGGFLSVVVVIFAMYRNKHDMEEEEANEYGYEEEVDEDDEEKQKEKERVKEEEATSSSESDDGKDY